MLILWILLKRKDLWIKRMKYLMKMMDLLIMISVIIIKVNGYINLSRTLTILKPRSVNRNLFIHQMFSGIIEEMGVVDKVERKEMELWDGSKAEGVEMTILSKNCLEDAYIGCSIAVNGVCLTATSIDTEKVSFGVAPETLRRTNLGILKQGSKVNLERALQANSRNSGHFVQGHVDCTGKIVEKWNEGESLWVKVMVPGEYMKYIVPKGFISVDGTSLTICDVKTTSKDQTEGWFTFMLIEHTQKHVIIPTKAIGELVNLEVDVLAKMVEKSLSALTEKFEKRFQEIESRMTVRRE